MNINQYQKEAQRTVSKSFHPYNVPAQALSHIIYTALKSSGDVDAVKKVSDFFGAKVRTGKVDLVFAPVKCPMPKKDKDDKFGVVTFLMKALNQDGYVVQKSSILGSGPIVSTRFAGLVPTGSSAGPYTPQGVDDFDTAATQGYFIGVDNASFGTLIEWRQTRGVRQRR